MSGENPQPVPSNVDKIVEEIHASQRDSGESVNFMELQEQMSALVGSGRLTPEEAIDVLTKFE